MRYVRSGLVVPLLLISHFVLAASPENSYHLRIAEGVDGQTLEGVFDFSWWQLSDRVFYSAGYSCGSNENATVLARLSDDTFNLGMRVAPLLNCTNCHCYGGGTNCADCSTNHHSAIVFNQFCQLAGCNENYCKEVPSTCCTLCTSISCGCDEPGYCN